MSVFSGKQKRGAKKAHKEWKRQAAEFRQAHFDADVDRVMAEQNVERPTAYDVVVRRRKMDRAMRSKNDSSAEAMLTEIFAGEK